MSDDKPLVDALLATHKRLGAEGPIKTILVVDRHPGGMFLTGWSPPSESPFTIFEPALDATARVANIVDPAADAEFRRYKWAFGLSPTDSFLWAMPRAWFTLDFVNEQRRGRPPWRSRSWWFRRPRAERRDFRW